MCYRISDYFLVYLRTGRIFSKNNNVSFVSIATRRVSYDCVREICNNIENVTHFVKRFVVILFIKQYYKRNTKFIHIFLKEHTSILFLYKIYLIKE